MTKTKLNVPAADLPESDVRPDDFRSSFPWRILRIQNEFVEGFEFLAKFNDIKTVSIFGGSRITEGDHWYEVARSLGSLLAQNGYGVVTGGGPGIMEAANRGAFEAGGTSIGLNIKLPDNTERANPYVKESISFHYFFSRKVMLSYAAQAYVYFPGGFGTMDEFFELTTLIETKKIPRKIPVILVGKEFWQPFVDWMRSQVYEKFKTVRETDLDIYTVVDTPEEAFAIIKEAPHVRYF